MAQISAGVGVGQPNKPGDVSTIQALVNRNILQITPLRLLKVDGQFGSNTELALKMFQERALRAAQPDGIVSAKGPTLAALASSPGSAAAKAAPKSATAETVGGLTDAEFVEIAKKLRCEAPAIKAIVKTELGVRQAFDDQGRPTILYERHVFSRLTAGKFDKDHPDIANTTAGGYGKFSEQHPKLDRAKKLDSTAALKSASWGAFQIMGENHLAAGFSTVDAFTKAMAVSIKTQIDAFVAFTEANPKLVAALRSKDWTTFARIYNGPAYANNAYDVKMKDNYNSMLGLSESAKPK